MENELIENHRCYLERVALYQQYGYDIEKERLLIIEKARPFSGNILEAGTGKGHFSLVLARAGFDFTSFDISAEEQRYAWLNLAYHELESHVRFDVADAERLPYKDSSFDVIFSVNLIHHLPSVRNFCSELGRVLSPSGKMILSDFNARGFALVDKIHALEGRRHDLKGGTLANTKAALCEYGMTIKEHYGTCQDLLIASRK